MEYRDYYETLGVARVPQAEQAVADEVCRPDPSHDREQSRVGRDETTDAEHAGDDEDRVAQGTDGDDEADVPARETGTEHVGVLRTDGHDERGHGEEAGQEGCHALHARGRCCFSEAKFSSASLA